MLSCSQCPEAGDSDESSDSWPGQVPSGCLARWLPEVARTYFFLGVDLC